MSQAEGVIKNIIRQIAQECAAQGNVVTDTLVAFVVKAVVLDPRNEFNVDRMLTKQDVHKLVQLCVEKLMEKCSPALDTIKMQVYFDMNYTSRSEFIEEHHGVLWSRLSPVMRDITDSRVKTREELEALYSTIIHYMLLSSGLGSPTDLNTVRETTAALQSVFPQVELGTFMSLLKRDKEQQLTELTMIVTGIRLFNKFSKKGGEGIDNLPKILREALPAASNVIEHELDLSQSLAWKYTAVLERLMGSDENQRLLVQLKQALYNVRQHQTFLKVILADVRLCAKQVERLRTDLLSRIQQLKDTVHTKTAVPTAQVFPHFRAVATLWRGLQDEMVVLSILDGMVTHMQPFLSSQDQLFSAGCLDGLLEGSDVKTDEDRMAECSGDCINPSEMKTQEWLLPETTANFDKLLLQYKGYCGYALVKKGGLLLPGNPSIGVLKHGEKFYVFSSKQAALSFASRADEMIESVGERAKRSPELIQLLQLHQQFSTVTPYTEMQSGESLLVKPITKCDSCTQTDTHLLETNIVKSYEWNEWELRRKAIKLANLRTTVTHSMQTALSHMRRDNSTQTFPPKDAACQTKRDASTSVPKPLVYLAGLRGNKAGQMIKTNLTTSIDE